MSKTHLIINVEQDIFEHATIELETPMRINLDGDNHPPQNTYELLGGPVVNFEVY